MSKMKLIIALAIALTLGAGALVAGDGFWSGTGLGGCTNDTITFTPFKTWEETKWSTQFPFSGEWQDAANSETGFFVGSWDDDPNHLPGQGPVGHISDGYWLRNIGNYTVIMGNYRMVFGGYWPCATITCHGVWTVTLEGWYALPVGIPPISGYYYSCPH